MSDNAFLRRKLKTQFRVFDQSGDKSLAKDDFQMLATNFIGAIGAKAEAKEEEIREKWAFLWDFLTLGEEDATIDEDTFVERAIAIKDSEGGKQMLSVLYTVLFDCIDADGDNLVDLQEFKAYLSALRIGTEHAQDLFNAIDVDKDGSLQNDEVTEAFLRYSTSDDVNDPTALLYGPLVD